MKNIGRTIILVTIIALVTKILTLVGNTLYISFFGTEDIYLNVYSYALGLPNNIFTSIGTALTTIIIPVYSSLIGNKENNRAKKFLDDIITISSILVLGLIFVCIIFAPQIINLSGFKNNQEQFKYGIFAIRILFPSMFFFCLNYIFTGILQSNNKFIISALVSLPSSLVVIIYVLFFAEKFGVTGLLVATLIGFILQPLILFPSIKKTGYKYKFSFDYKNQDIIKSFKLIPSILLGVCAYQINMLYNINLSTAFKTTSMISYVQNLMLTPVLMIITSITSVYYPRMSNCFGKNDLENYKKSVVDVISILSLLLIPATFGIIILRHEIIDIVRWGKFSESEGLIAGNILGLYGIGILFVGLKEGLDKAFYSKNLTKPSAIVGVIIMTTNIVSSLLLKNKLGTYSIPISYSLSAILGSIILYLFLRRDFKNEEKKIFKNLFKSLIAGIIMGAIVFLTKKYFTNINLSSQLLTRLLRLIIPVIIGVIIYFVFAIIFNISNSKIFIKNFLSNLKK